MIDETLLEAEEKMDKGRGGREGGLRRHPHRPGATRDVRQDHGRVLRHPTPLQQLASFQVPEPRMVIISPYDKGAMAAIEKAIRDSDLGVNPGNDGAVIRVVMPQLTEERRKEYIKVAKTKAEDGQGLRPQHPPARQGRGGQDRQGRRGRARTRARVLRSGSTG